MGVITGAFIEALSIVPQIAKSSPLNPEYIGVSLLFGTMLIVVSMLTSALTALYSEEDKDNNSQINEESRVIVLSQLYAYGYDVIRSIMHTLSLVLPDNYKVESIDDLIPLAHKLTSIIRDKDKLARLLLGIIHELNEIGLRNAILKHFVFIEGFGQLVSEVKSIEKVSFRITYYISKHIKEAINEAGGGILRSPDKITLQEFVKLGEELIIDPNEFMNPDGKNLPGLIDMLALLTSHYILIEADVNDGEAKARLAFRAKEYLVRYGEVKMSEIESFVASYLKYYRFFVKETEDEQILNKVKEQNALINV